MWRLQLLLITVATVASASEIDVKVSGIPDDAEEAEILITEDARDVPVIVPLLPGMLYPRESESREVN